MAILDDIKKELRISNTAYDTEISDLISFSKIKLSKTGILHVDDTDELIKRAISLYVKSQFGWDNPDTEKLKQLYDQLESFLKLSNYYAYYTVTFNLPEQNKIMFDGKVKESDDSGVVIFYSKPKNHVRYMYEGAINYVDVTDDTVVDI